MKRFLISFLVALFSLFAKDVKICLFVTVDEDGGALLKCLESAQGIADAVCVYDLFSKDSHRLQVEGFLQKTKIPGVIVEKDPWQCIDQLVNQEHFGRDKTYILSLCSNMVVRVDASFSKEMLSHDAYLLLERNGHFSSYSNRLFKINSISIQPSMVAKMKSISIDVEEDFHRKVKTHQDILACNPDHRESLFLLAQSKQALHEYEEAIRYYRKRIELQGDSEECWFSYLMTADCYAALNQWSEALYWYLETFHFNPNRADPLKRLSSYYRFSQANDIAYLFAKFGSLFPGVEDRAYYERDCLENYGFDEELAIVSFYTKFKDDGYAACSDLVVKQGVPSALRDQTYRNLLFYVKPLSDAEFFPVEMELPTLGRDRVWRPMNPSIVTTSSGYHVICRLVNYVQKGAKEFHAYDEQGIFRTRNFLLEYTKDFRFLSQKEILENPPHPKRKESLVQGLEDCRIFKWDHDFYFICTTTDTNPMGSPQISLCSLEPYARNEARYVDQFLPLQGPDPYRCEKNWLPFVHNGQLLFIYSYEPLTMYSPSLSTGACECVHRSSISGYDFSSFRGSSGPVALDEGFLILVHEVVFLPGSERVYLHRFVLLDRSWDVSQISKPFIFQHQGVEFCTGMCLDHDRKHLILTLGIEDHDAYFCKLDIRKLPVLTKVGSQ